MKFIYAYEIIALAMLIVVTWSYLTKKWLFLYKNVVYVGIQFCAIAILIVDLAERCINHIYRGSYIGYNVGFSEIAFIGALVIIDLFDIYFIAYVENMKVIKEKKFWLCQIPLFLTLFCVISTQYSHLFFWFDEKGVYHRGEYIALYILCIIFYVALGVYIIYKRRENILPRVRVLMYGSGALLCGFMLIQYSTVNEYMLTFYGVAAIVVVFYLLLHNSEPYIVHSSKCFSRAGFNKVVNEKILYHRDFYCLAICLCNIESITDYCLEDEISIMHERLGKIMCDAGGKHHVYQPHSSEYIIMTDTEKKVEEIYRKLRKSLPGMIRINDKNISLFYRYFVISGKDADFNYADFSRIMISMKKKAIDTNNDHVLLTYTGNVRKSITRELSIIRMINEIVSSGRIDLECIPIYNLKENGRITSLEINPKLKLDDKQNVTIDEFWSISREMGCSKDSNIAFWRNVLSFLVKSDIFGKGIEQININISPYHIASEMVCMEYISMLAEYKIPADRIVLEFTIEPTISDDIMKHSIEVLREHGIKVCWDNFGVNSCNLNNIMGIPFDAVKVSRELAIPFCKEESSQLLYIIRMLKRRNWDVAIEGIDYTEYFNMFRDLGVKYIQGSKVDEFMSEDETIEFLIEKGGVHDGKL